MIVPASITVIILTAIASHVHCDLNPSVKKQQKLPTQTAHNLIWKELLTYHTCAFFNSKLQAVKSKKNCKLFLLDWDPSSLLVDDVVSDVVVDVRGLVASVLVWSADFEVFVWQSLLPTAVVEFLTACPTDSITLNVASPRLPTTFSSNVPTLLNVSCIALE